MSNISVIIVAKDNPPHLEESIQSVSFATEIIIADIGLTPQCKKNLQQYSNVRIIPIEEEVRYVEQIREKSFTFAQYDYILLLDPDEVISEGLKEKILESYSSTDYISLPRKNIIFGKWIQYSRWWPDYQIRFFKKNTIHWPTKLHAQPETSGKGYMIEAREEHALIHYNYENVTEYLNKMIRYAESEAKELVEAKKIYTIGTAMNEGIQEFISRFFAEKGYKDGMHGLILALLQMIYKLFVFFYYWEKMDYHDASQNEIVSAPQLLFRQGLYETNHWLGQEKLTSRIVEVKNKIINKIL